MFLVRQRSHATDWQTGYRWQRASERARPQASELMFIGCAHDMMRLWCSGLANSPSWSVRCRLCLLCAVHITPHYITFFPTLALGRPHPTLRCDLPPVPVPYMCRFAHAAVLHSRWHHVTLIVLHERRHSCPPLHRLTIGPPACVRQCFALICTAVRDRHTLMVLHPNCGIAVGLSFSATLCDECRCFALWSTS